MNEENIHQPKLMTRECEELNVWSSELGWETDYRQIAGGAFKGSWEMSLCHRLGVADQYSSRAMSATGVAPAGLVVLLLPLNQGERGIFHGKTLKQNEAIIMGPDCASTYRTPPELRLVTLYLPDIQVRESFRTITNEDAGSSIDGTRLIKLSSEISGRMTSIVREVLDRAPDDSDERVSDIWLREVEEDFATVLVAGLTGKLGAEPGRLDKENRGKYVAVARDYIETHLDTSLGLETLARVTGVSPRTLEYAFREIFDTTPLRYIKIRRLHAARQRLLAATDKPTSVTAVAMQYGFKHLSYFSQDYRELFGEYPLETLKCS